MMFVDIAGRVDNIQLSPERCLAPLFEAVVNSIQAVQDLLVGGGAVRIDVRREPMKPDLGIGPQAIPPVIGFAVTDNGIGFCDANFTAFRTSDTTFKEQVGGKGVGRFLWLKAFDHVTVRSVFAQNGGTFKRDFEFRADGDGIFHESFGEADSEPAETVVELVDFKDRFGQKCSRKLEDIATSAIEHCLEYLIQSDCPRIEIHDGSGDPICLNTRFQSSLLRESKDEELTIRTSRFHIKHIRLASVGGLSHAVHYCAHNRVVKSEKALRAIPELAVRPTDGGCDFTYTAYVSGGYLDANVNQERTDFTFPRTRKQETLYDMCFDELEDMVIGRSRSYLEPHIAPIQEKSIERARRYIGTKGPQYRHLLTSHLTQIQRIPPDVKDDELEILLYQLEQDDRSRTMEKVRRIIEGSDDSPKLAEAAERALAEISDVSQRDLTRYVVQRKLILELVDKYLGRQEDGRTLAKAIYTIIFPMESHLTR